MIDVIRLPALCRRLTAIDRGEMRTKDGEGRETTTEWRASFAEQVALIISAMSDADLLRIYDGEPGNLEADTLLAEIKRRGLYF